MTSPRTAVSRKLVIGAAVFLIAFVALAFWLRMDSIERLSAVEKPGAPRTDSARPSAQPAIRYDRPLGRESPGWTWHSCTIGKARSSTGMPPMATCSAKPSLNAAVSRWLARRLKPRSGSTRIIRKPSRHLPLWSAQRAAATPRQRAELRDALTRIEPLQSVPSGPSLALLVVRCRQLRPRSGSRGGLPRSAPRTL